MSQQPGDIIVLNGASSAGKTRTAEALLLLLKEDCIYTGLDDILARIKPYGAEGMGTLIELRRSINSVWFQLTDGRLRLFKQLHREVVSHSCQGQTVIVETALMDRRALYDAALCFAPLNALFVGMKPPLSVSEQWEGERGDRPCGQARKHYDLIHAHGIYDLVLDPSTMTPQECALTILKQLEEEVRPQAFRQLLTYID